MNPASDEKRGSARRADIPSPQKLDMRYDLRLCFYDNVYIVTTGLDVAMFFTLVSA